MLISNSSDNNLSFSIESDPFGFCPQESIILAGIRDADFKIHFIELNAVTARLIELLQQGLNTGKQALLELADELHYSDPETILPFGVDILQQLKIQHIIIGVQHEQ